LKYKNTQTIYIFNRENSQNSDPQNGPRRGLDFIALPARIRLIGDPFISFLVKTIILSKLARAPKMQIDRHIPP
jgi:hypothetical protein